MPDQDMFGLETEQQNAGETLQSAQPDLFADKLKEIKNEQGEQKYADLPTALDALKASQQYIETLKAESLAAKSAEAEARAEAERLGNIEDFVNRLKPNTPTAEPKETPKVEAGLSEEKVAQLLQAQLQKRDQESQQESNLVKVTSKLSEVYGDKSATHLEQRAKELGTTKAGLKDLAMANPQMALALLVTQSPSSPKPSHSSLTSTQNAAPAIERPKVERGATRGGRSDRELAELFRKSKEYTNQRIGLEL